MTKYLLNTTEASQTKHRLSLLRILVPRFYLFIIITLQIVCACDSLTQISVFIQIYLYGIRAEGNLNRREFGRRLKHFFASLFSRFCTIAAAAAPHAACGAAPSICEL